MTTGQGKHSCTHCEAPASFAVFEPVSKNWRTLCEQHTRTLHPSLEIKAWLESGYAKPIELGVPEASPDDPAGGRARAFRKLVDSTMEWDDRNDATR